MAVLQWILGTGDINDINVYNGIKKIYENMNYTNNYDITYSFIHIKSHTTTTMNGNDLVDHLAKYAMLHAWEKKYIKKKH